MRRCLLITFTSMMMVVGEASFAALPPGPDDLIMRPGSPNAPIPPMVSENEIEPSDDGLQTDQWYTVNETASMQLYKSKKHRNLNVPVNLSRLTLVEGTEYQILKFSPDGEYALIAVDEDGFSHENPGVNDAEPVLAWVRTADLVQTRSQVVEIEALQNLAELGIVIDPPSAFSETDVAGKNYQRRRGGQGRRYSTKATSTKRTGKKKRRSGGGGGGGGMTYCLRDVRVWAASKIGVKKVPQNIEMASQAYPQYKAAGWTEIAYSPSNPVGTACFFQGGRKCGSKSYCGHAAIKIAANKWKGAGIRPTPFLRSDSPGRKPLVLQGCLLMPI